jgi:asparagine synthase (glutamine-hydrolysing)
MLLGSTQPLGPASVNRGFHNPFERRSLPSGAIPAVEIANWNVATLDSVERSALDESSGSWLVLSGQALLLGTESGATDVVISAAELLTRLSQRGVAALEQLDGHFAIAWWHAPDSELRLIRDRFGIEPLFYTGTGGRLTFASRIRDLVGRGFASKTLSHEGLAEYLVFCFVPSRRTLHADVWRVPAGGIVTWVEGRPVRIDRWYRLRYDGVRVTDEREITERFRNLLEQAVVRRVGGADPSVMVSGGMDSSSVLAFTRRHWTGPIKTYGYRCGGASFDESHYARALARELDATHTEVQFGERESLTILDAIGCMEVPFCDVGVELGNWLVGRAAQGSSSHMLTGDGGDEFWASHPVYAAQRIVAWYDRARIPDVVHRGLWQLASLLHDPEAKRSLSVILKRLLPQPGLPRSLRHFRWRVYDRVERFPLLVVAEWSARMSETDPFDCVREAFEGYQGPDDGISPMLYADYTAQSSFYFSRLLFSREFGIESRLPFYDRRLVEFGTRVPPEMKLEGIERTKRLFRDAMQGVLPEVVRSRKDKLGHSIPLKNWLRGRGELARLVGETLASESLERRGIFRTEIVRQMLEEHASRRHNHSHRIWALFVLEQWLRRHME